MARRLNFSRRVPDAVCALTRWPNWGEKGLKTESVPSLPVTRACRWSRDEENMEQRMRAVPPSGSEKRASMARSTPAEDSLARALETRGPAASNRSSETG